MPDQNKISPVEKMYNDLGGQKALSGSFGQFAGKMYNDETYRKEAFKQLGGKSDAAWMQFNNIVIDEFKKKSPGQSDGSIQESGSKNSQASESGSIQSTDRQGNTSALSDEKKVKPFITDFSKLINKDLTQPSEEGMTFNRDLEESKVNQALEVETTQNANQVLKPGEIKPAVIDGETVLVVPEAEVKNWKDEYAGKLMSDRGLFLEKLPVSGAEIEREKLSDEQNIPIDILEAKVQQGMADKYLPVNLQKELDVVNRIAELQQLDPTPENEEKIRSLMEEKSEMEYKRQEESKKKLKSLYDVRGRIKNTLDTTTRNADREIGEKTLKRLDDEISGIENSLKPLIVQADDLVKQYASEFPEEFSDPKLQGKSPLERMRFTLMRMQDEKISLEKKEAEELGMLKADAMGMLGYNILNTVGMINSSYGGEIAELDRKIKSYAPAAFLNITPESGRESGGIRFMKQIPANLSEFADRFDVREEKAIGFQEFLEEAGVSGDVRKDFKEQLTEETKAPEFGTTESNVDLLATTAVIVPQLAVGSGAVSQLTKVKKFASIYDKLTKVNKAARFKKLDRLFKAGMKQGIDFEAAGQISRDKREELSFLPGFFGGMAGAAISPSLSRFADELGSDLMKKAGKVVATGFGETAEEYGEVLGGALLEYSESGDLTKALKSIDDQIGTLSKNAQLVVSSFVLGSGMKVGMSIGGGDLLMADNLQAYNSLSETEKKQVQESLKRIDSKFTDLDVFNMTEDYASNLQEEVDNAVKNKEITEEDAAEITSEIGIALEVSNSMDKELPMETQKAISPFIAAKQEMLRKKKQIDSSMHEGINNDIDAIDNSIQQIISAEKKRAQDKAQEPAQEETQDVAPTQQIDPQESKVPEIVGREVDYGGIVGRVEKQGDDYYVTDSEGETTLIEGGLSGQTVDQLGISVFPQTEAEKATDSIEADFDNNTITLRGKNYEYVKTNLDENGDAVSVTMKNDKGKEITVRSESTVDKIQYEKSLWENRDADINEQQINEAAKELNIKPTQQSTPTIQPEGQGKDTKQVKGEEGKIDGSTTTKEQKQTQKGKGDQTKDQKIEGGKTKKGKTRTKQEGGLRKGKDQSRLDETKEANDKSTDGKTLQSIEETAKKSGVKAKNIKGLYDINRKMFGQNRVKALAGSVVMDRAIGQMAKRSGISKSEMYDKIQFKKSDKAPKESLKQASDIFKSNAKSGLSKLNLQPSRPDVWIKKISEAGGKGTAHELEVIGVKDFMEDWMKENKAKSVPKEVVEQYINDNQIEIQEITKGGNVDNSKRIKDIEDKLNSEGYSLEADMGGEGFILLDKNGEIAEYDDVPEHINKLHEEFNGISEDNFNSRSQVGGKYSDQTLKGGGNYREVLLTMPNREPVSKLSFEEWTKDWFGDVSTLTENKLDLARKQYDSKTSISSEEVKNKKEIYRSSHWDEGNILAHVRLNERVLPNGEKVLFIEEVQSDWAQEGREKGFKDSKKEKLLEKISKNLSDVNNKSGKWKDATSEQLTNEIKRISKEIKDNNLTNVEVGRFMAAKESPMSYATNLVPDMPYKKTDQWAGMAMRRIMKMAADEGFDRVAWVTGEQSADRYDLSKEADIIKYEYDNDRLATLTAIKDGKVTFTKRMKRDEDISPIVGKEMAEKLLNKEPEELATGEKVHSLEGKDLSVGGEGMKAFYNQIIPKIAKKEAQRFDKKAKVEVSEVIMRGKDSNYYALIERKKEIEDFYKEKGNTPDVIRSRDADLSDIDAIIKRKYGASKQLSIAITPEMRMNLNSAVPLFQKDQGAMMAEDGQYTIFALTDPNISTPLHEIAHVYEHYLTDSERTSVLKWTKQKEWNTATSEKFARGFEKYLADGKAPTVNLKKIFDKFKEWLTEIYNGIKGSEIDLELNSKMQEIYDTMLGGESTQGTSDSSDVNIKDNQEKKFYRRVAGLSKPATLDVFGFSININKLNPFRGGFKKFIKRNFTKENLFPTEMYDFIVKRDNNINATVKEIEFLSDELINRIGKKAPAEVYQKYDAALKGEKVDLPKEDMAIIKQMRDHIDALSNEMKAVGLTTEELDITFDKNKGTYVHRSYRIHEAKDVDKFKDTIPMDVYDRAILWAEKSLKEQGGVEGDIREAAKSLIDSKIAEQFAKKSGASQDILGKQDRSTLKKKKDIPEPLRDLYGEYLHPNINYVKTVSKMVQAIENRRMLNGIKQEGIKMGLMVEGEPKGNMTEKVTFNKKDQTLNPMNNTFVNMDMKIALEDFGNKMAYTNKFLQKYMKYNAYVKAGKTIFSHATQARNILSNANLIVSTGAAFDTSAWKNVLSLGKKRIVSDRNLKSLTFRDSSKTQGGRGAKIIIDGRETTVKDYVQDAVRRGVMHDTTTIGLLRDMIDDADGGSEIIDMERFSENTIKRMANKTAKFAEKAYQAGDDFFKLLIFESEKAKYSKALYGKETSELTDSQLSDLKDYVGKIVPDIAPTYSRVPRAVRALRIIPVIGTFPSFTWESLRTSINQAKLIGKELRSDNPEIKKIGAKRFVTFGIGRSFNYLMKAGIVSLMSNALSSDDEEDHMRRFLPEWSENHMIIALKDMSKDGVYHVSDLTQMDIYGAEKLIPMAMMNDNNSLVEGIIKGTQELLSPFIGEEILFRLVVDLKSNSYHGTDRPIYNPDDVGSVIYNSLDYITNTVAPGSVRSLKRLASTSETASDFLTATRIPGLTTAYRPERSGSAEALAQLGVRISTIDIAKSLRNNTYGFRDKRDAIEEDIKKNSFSWETQNEKYQEIQEELMKDVSSARALGLSEKKIRESVYKALRSKSATNKILRGAYSDLKESSK